MTFQLMLQHVAGMATVDDRPLLDAMFYLWERLKLLVEPTGALGAAAAFEKLLPIADRRVGILLSGGNVDLSQVGAWQRQTARLPSGLT
jgi:threonine dehydratase